ncbi:MAG TPA: hypothetical protein EYP85_06370 [Armatimonadetes bacterium]|nr:hypothetical protein [Armatimonadota bacterium]
MIPLKAKKICLVEGVEDDPRMRARAQRLATGIQAERVERVGDAELAQMVADLDPTLGQRHGMEEEIEPLVIFNRFRFEDSPEERERRRRDFPALFANPMHKFSGYGGFDWRESGSASWRARTGLVCQPAWQLHTIVGCHFRCAYCSLGRFVNIMLNIEEFVERLDAWLATVPGQTLYQYDNWTDTVCFEPEYGGAKLLIEYFAQREGEYLELYVGKSDHVDYLLDLDHRGHTVCCWSLSGPTQSTLIERKTAPMHARIAAARRCQQAGYHVRFRFSPLIPVRDWQAENREMIEALFSEVHPDLITFETLRFLNYEALAKYLDLSLLDPEFVALMEQTRGVPQAQGCEIPDEYRLRVYRFIIDELERVSPQTPYALCREKRAIWEVLAEDFARHGQSPDRYICNCGPTSAPRA